MPTYVKWIYPQIEIGKSHKRPEMPLCFIRLAESSTSWSIHSIDDNDRAEYWEVDVAKMDVMHSPMTIEEVELAVYGIDGKSAWIAALPSIPEV